MYLLFVAMSNFEIATQKYLIRDKLRKSHPKIKLEMSFTDAIIDCFPKWDFFFKYNSNEKMVAMTNVLKKFNGVLDQVFYGSFYVLGLVYAYIIVQSIKNYH